MTDRSITITYASNGFIITEVELDSEGDDFISTTLYEQADDDGLSAVQTMLYDILEWSGHLGSKHDKRRIRIEIEEREDD